MKLKSRAAFVALDFFDTIFLYHYKMIDFYNDV